MELSELRGLQDLPLDYKILITDARIRDWYEYHNGKVIVSTSGGKDSCVLLHRVRLQYPEVPALFSDTGLEYPSLKQFVLQTPNLYVIRPKMTFPQVIKRYGYPLISKPQAMAIHKLKKQNLTPQYRNKLLYGDEKGKAGMLAKKHHYLLDAPFDISGMCCDAMKKRPLKAFTKKTGLVPFTGEMASEDANRQMQWLRTGCNAYDLKHPKSMPLGFWTDQDILEYIRRYNIDIPDVYGDIVEKNGKLVTTGERRTGCMWCLFGIHMEPKDNNRFHRMKISYPEIYDYCINKLEIGKVLDYIGVGY